MTELLRAYVVFVCFVNLGVMLGLFERVGRFFIPKVGMRSLLFGNAVVIGAVGVGNVVHLHSPLVTVSYAIVVGVTIQLVALGGLWYWYGTPEGMAHSERMLSSIREAHERREPGTADVERRLRTLTIGVFFLYGIALISIVVVGYFEAVTRTSLCTFRDDLSLRVSSSEEILSLPGNEGEVIHVFGVSVPRSVVVTQLAAQQAALRSLNGLRCP